MIRDWSRKCWCVKPNGEPIKYRDGAGLCALPCSWFIAANINAVLRAKRERGKRGKRHPA